MKTLPSRAGATSVKGIDEELVLDSPHRVEDPQTREENMTALARPPGRFPRDGSTTDMTLYAKARENAVTGWMLARRAT